MTTNRTRDNIIAYATKQFFTYGYSKISTEELATGLAMSKSTLYKYFPGKDVLLDAVIDSFYRNQTAVIEDIVGNGQTAIRQKIEKFLTIVGSRLSILKKEALQDLERSVPEAYARLMELRKKVIMEQLSQLYRQGALSGEFRSDIEPDFVMNVFLAAIETLSKPDYLSHSSYSYDTVAKHVFTLIFEGYLPR